MDSKSGKPLAVFVAVAFLILATGGWYYVTQKESVQREVSARLEAVAKLKVSEIAGWRAELLADARVLMQSPFFAEGAAKFLETGDRADSDGLERSFRSRIENYRYISMLLADSADRVRFTTAAESKALDPEEIFACNASRASRSPTLTDLHKSGAEGKPHLNVISPLFTGKGAGEVFAGCVVIRVDPSYYLYPMIQSWPLPSASAESLLVRRDGDSVLFLNELRHLKNTTLSLKIPLTSKDVPAVRAVLGEEGAFMGTDYRGVEVVSSVARVPESNWAVVAKMDAAEAFNDWEKESTVIIAALALALLLVFAMKRMLEEKAACEHLDGQLATEKIRRELDRRYAVTLMCIGDGVIVTDREGRVELFNPVAEALTGWLTAEARGRPLDEVFDIVNEQTRAKAKNPVDEVLARGVIVGLANHTLLIAKDGGERPIADSAAPIRAEGEDLSGVVLVFRDQSQEHDASKKLAESEIRYRELFNGMMEGFALHELITDARGAPADYRFLAVNPAFERMTGMKAADAIGKRVLELIPDLEPYWIEKYGSVALTGEQLAFENYNAALDKYFQVFAYRPREGQFACLFRDVTDQVLARKAVESRILALTRPVGDVSGLTFSDLFSIAEIQDIQDKFASAAGVASIITDTEGKPLTEPSKFTRFCSDLVRCSERGLSNCYKSDKVLGALNTEGPTVTRCLSGGLWDAGAAITVGGRHIANWLIGQVRDETQTEEGIRAYAREIAVDEELAVEAFREVPRMSKERFHAVAEALYALAGQLSTMAFVNMQQARFISDLKRGDDEKADLQEKLQQSHKLESVGRLAGGVAHDFNNMLGVILGHAEMALEQLADGDDLREDLIEIQKAANRSADITRQLLAFARKQSVSPKVVDVNVQVENSLKMLRRLIGEDIEIEWSPGQELWKVMIDPTQLDQLLANLATNARDAIEGVGKITIETSNAEIGDTYSSLHPESQPGGYVMVAVSDTGKGIKQELLGHIFEPFFTTKGVGQGTGLGLATVYGIAKQNGGFVNVYSEPKHGATFRVYLPRFAALSDQKVQLPQSKARGGHETVLVVEDEKGLLTLARRVLTSLGYKVYAANSTVEAIEIGKAEAGKIDLLVTDVVMPEMNGRELAQAISLHQPQVKVLFMSGYTADVVAHHGVIDEGVNFISKPFSVKELGEKVRRVLDDLK